MKRIFYLIMIFPLLFACSEDVMDEVNKDQNNALQMDANNLLPDLLLKSAFETTATDLAWYATVYIEHNAGTWNQSHQADRRLGQESSSLLNNSWNSLYDVMNIAKTIIDKTDPTTGTEPINTGVRAIAHIMMAYNLATATDFWGEVPYAEAFKGASNLNPSYQKQSELYPIIIKLLEDAIKTLDATATIPVGGKDYIYRGSVASWRKAANSLLARYNLRLVNVNGAQAAQNALNAIAAGAFESASDQFALDGFVFDLPGANPWGEFYYLREHLSVSTTIFDLMMERNDTARAAMYFNSTDPDDIAPIGQAVQTQGGYAQSNYTSGWDIAWESPIYMMTYHELKFIEAEAKFRTGDDTWKASLQEAVQAAFDFHGKEIGTYFEVEVEPRLTAGNELKEIITQKYIAFYDREAIEAYNDYRRTGFPTMMNPNNATVGFVNRAPFALSEVSSNSANVPSVNIFTDKVWWAGGAEK
jgi:hypothetical protein